MKSSQIHTSTHSIFSCIQMQGVFVQHFTLYPHTYRGSRLVVVWGPCLTCSTWHCAEPDAWSGCWGRKNSCHTWNSGTSSLRCGHSDGPSGWWRWRTAFHSGGRERAFHPCAPSGGAWGCIIVRSSSRNGCTGMVSPLCGFAHVCAADTGGRSSVNKRCRRRGD